jgi:hypothetical protein
MDSWKDAFASMTEWAESHGLTIDALGLVTLLGSNEVDACVGRLVQSSWVEFLPLLGAFVLSGDLFREKKPGYKLYNLTAGMTTTDLAGWLTRWMKAQDLEQTRSIVEWTVGRRPSRLMSFWIPSVSIGLAFNGMLLVLTLLSGDWFGFANSVAMITSVLVREILILQNCAGIDRQIEAAKSNHKYGGNKLARTLVVLDDSKTITMDGPSYLMGGVFTRQPDIPNQRIYSVTRWIGWLAFAVHILTLGMAALHSQIYTALLMIIATILTTYKLGCEDSNILRIAKGCPELRDNETRSCWITSRLQARVTVYPEDWAMWPKDLQTNSAYRPEPQATVTDLESTDDIQSEALMHIVPAGYKRSPQVGRDGPGPVREGSADLKKAAISEQEYEDDKQSGGMAGNGLERGTWISCCLRPRRSNTNHSYRDEEAGAEQFQKSEGRQDLYVWLKLKPREWDLIGRWELVPYEPEWRDEYERKKLYHSRRRSRQEKTSH